MGEVLVEAYDGTIVRVPIDKKDEYLELQNKIKEYIKEGKSIKDIKNILKEVNHD